MSLANWIEKTEKNIWYRLFRLVLPFLAVGGLIFAIYDNQQSNQKAEDIIRNFDSRTDTILTKSQDDADKIAKQISTRYVANFPDQIDNIAEEIKASQVNLILAVDVPAYGAFSKPKAHNNYWIQLQRKILDKENVGFQKLTMICYSEKKRKHEFFKQFGIDSLDFENKQAFSNYPKKEKDKDAWNKKLNRYKLENQIKVIETWKQLYEYTESQNQEIIKFFKDHKSKCELIEINDLSEPLPVYFWLFDNDRHAFISFRSYGELTTEVTIGTTHTPILKYVRDVIDDVKRAIKK